MQDRSSTAKPARSIASGEDTAADGSDTDTAAAHQAGVQSVEIAARVLRALAEQGRPLALKAIAQAAGMSRAKAHRYLVSLKRTGLVVQEARSGDYRIGPAAVTLGLVGLRSLSPVRAVHDALPALRDRIEETVTMAIWGDNGPTVIAMEEGGPSLTINVRVGSVLPMVSSAIGRVFAAFLPDFMTRAQIARDRVKAEAEGALLPGEVAFAAILDDVRARNMARVKGAVLPGVDALAAPVFDHGGRLIAVVCTLGRSATFDAKWGGPCASALAQTTGELSRQFGFVERDSAG
jgi:DNA-binding IclR family transcriptional regulator